MSDAVSNPFRFGIITSINIIGKSNSFSKIFKASRPEDALTNRYVSFSNMASTESRLSSLSSTNKIFGRKEFILTYLFVKPNPHQRKQLIYFEGLCNIVGSASLNAL